MGSSLGHGPLEPRANSGKEPQGRSSEPWEKIGGTEFSGKETVFFFLFLPDSFWLLQLQGACLL